MKRSSTLGLRIFTSAFLILFTFAQPLLAIESLFPGQDAATTVDGSMDILDEGISDPEEIAKPIWTTSGESATTSSPVIVGDIYTYPINPALTVTFTKLPEVSSTLIIKTIYLTEDQVKATHAASNVAYDITTDMSDGTFKYDLTLPKAGESTNVVYAESVSGLLNNDVKDISNVVNGESSLKITGLNHFTIFVVTTDSPALSSTACVDAGATSGSDCYNSIQLAVDAAHDGDTIRVNAGTYVLNSPINMDTPNVTLVGVGNPIIQVSGTGYRFIMTASGNTISGFNIQKTDTTGGQDIIWINASNTSILNNELSGQFVIGDPEVSRAILISGGHSGLLIQNNIFHNLRQPAYISGVTTGTISNNFTYITKGWVLENGDMTFVNNTWGTGANSNVFDIAIIPEVNPIYYTDIAAMSDANNDAVIEDQRVTPRLLSDVYVDASTSFTTDLGGKFHPYSSLTPAIDRVVPGGTIHILSDLTISSQFTINKSVTIEGNGHTIFSPFAFVDTSNNSGIGIQSDNVTIRNLTVDGTGSVKLHGINIYTSNNILLDHVTASNNTKAGILVNGSLVTVKDITTLNNAWGGINVDLGVGVTSQAKLTVEGTSTHSEAAQIWIQDVTKPASVVDVQNQYDSNDFGNIRVYNLKIATPQNLGWNLQSKSVTPNETPLDLACSINTVYTGENSVAQNWTAVSGLNIKYQREVTYPTSSIGYFEAGANTFTPFSTFGSNTGIEGLWKTRVRAYVDINMNNSLDNGEQKSEWSNYCSITLDKTAPSVVTGLNFSDKGSTEIKSCGLKTASHVGAVIHWDANTDADFDHYEYRSFNADGSTGPLRVFTTNSFDASWWTVPMEGIYGFEVRAVDKAGNAGAWTNRCNIVEDWTAPDVSTTGIRYPNMAVVNSFITSYNTPTIVGGILSSDTVSVELTVNSQTYIATISGSTWEANATNIVPDGTYDMQIVATDDVGNSKTTIQSITIDTKAPTATYTHYKDNIEVLGAQAFVNDLSLLTFTGSYTDETPSSGLYWDSFVIFDAQTNGSFAFAQNGAKSYCSWRQAPNLVTLSGNPFSFTTPRAFTDCVATLPEGTYYMTHQVYDNATRKDIPSINQFRDVLGLKFTVDMTAPESTFDDGQSNTFHNSAITIKGKTDDTNGVTGVTLYYSLSGADNWTEIVTIGNGSNDSPFSWSYDWTPDNEGTYDIKAEGTDIAGNQEASPMITGIVYDITKPTVQNVNITMDYFGTYVNGRTGFMISVPVSDSLSGINKSTCKYTIDGSTWSTASFSANRCMFWVDDSRLFDTAGLVIGARVDDKAGNTSTSNIVERKVDKALPISQANIDNTFYGPNMLPEVKGTATDTVSHITNVMISLRRNSDSKYWIAGNLWMNISLPLHNTTGAENWTYNSSFPTMSNGVTYTVTPYAWDQVHAETQPGVRDSFIWDSIKPTDPSIFRSNPVIGVPSNDNTVTVSFSGAEDATSGVAGYYYSFSLIEETPAINPANWLPVGTTSITSPVLTDGVWYFNIRTLDNAGNITSTAHYGAFMIDTTEPVAPSGLSFETLGAEALGCGSITNLYDIVAKWQSSSDDSGIDYYEYQSFNPTTGWIWNGGNIGNVLSRTGAFTVGDGVYGFAVRAVDKAGNYSNWSSEDLENSCKITYDATAPDVQITAPISTYLTGTVEVRGTVTDINPHHYWFVITNSSGTQVAGLGTVSDTTSFTDKHLLNWNTTSLPDGKYTIKLEARDAANNKDAGSVQWLVVNVDHTQPTVDLQFETPSPTATSFNAVFSEDVNKTDAENPANYFLNNWPTASESGDLVGDATISYDSSTLTATITFTDPSWHISPEQQWGVQDIHDLAGNILAANPHTEYSTPMVAPVTTVSGIDTMWHNGDVTVTLSCTDIDGSGCYMTHYSINGDPEQIGNVIIVSAEGANTITYYSEDKAGNIEIPQISDVIKIDLTKPEAGVLGATTFITGENTPRSLSLTDNNALSQVCYVIDTNTQECLPIFGTGYSWDITSLINTLGVGPHTFSYYVLDTAGNQSDFSTTVDGDNPYIASILVNAVPVAPATPAVAGATTQRFVATDPTDETTSPEGQKPAEESTTPITGDIKEVKGVEDANTTEEIAKKGCQWWIYALGSALLLSFIIFLIARRRRKDEEEKKY